MSTVATSLRKLALGLAVGSIAVAAAAAPAQAQATTFKPLTFPQLNWIRADLVVTATGPHSVTIRNQGYADTRAFTVRLGSIPLNSEGPAPRYYGVDGLPLGASTTIYFYDGCHRAARAVAVDVGQVVPELNEANNFGTVPAAC